MYGVHVVFLVDRAELGHGPPTGWKVIEYLPAPLWASSLVKMFPGPPFDGFLNLTAVS